MYLIYVGMAGIIFSVARPSFAKNAVLPRVYPLNQAKFKFEEIFFLPSSKKGFYFT
jgi:hypothetical protein